jgi:hypothetical protein
MNDPGTVTVLAVAQVIGSLVDCLEGWPAALDTIDGHRLDVPGRRRLILDFHALRNQASALDDQARNILDALEAAALR